MTDHQSDSRAQPLSSVFTSSFGQILNQLKLSLVVSTYQAGKVILVRYDPDSQTVNTHFRNFSKPMGIAMKGHRLTIGGQKTVSYLRNMPAVARKLEPVGKHDACYLPRRMHVTGDIDIHEMAWGIEPESGQDKLWLVNTRFGCLCTLDDDHSFFPRWRPHFVTAYVAEDRCHLNGLALVNGRPKYVTALGESNTANGWRENKADGGILMDVERNEVLWRGLSMPHSPRWYNNRLWLLESGKGTLAWIDLKNKSHHPVIELPGFTRGLDFYGPLAFIGLSQVRESATFSGIPLMERLGEERTCGVWVVNIQTSQMVAFLRFESGVEEIFAVQLLPNIRFPEILPWNNPHMGYSYVLPDHALAEVPNAEPA